MVQQMVDCSEESQFENIYRGYVYCTLKGAGPDKSNIRRDGIGMGMFGQNMKIVFVGQK